MPLESLEDKLVVNEYGRLVILALNGKTGDKLTSLEELYSERGEEMEFAPIVKSRQDSFLTGFHYNPPVEFFVSHRNLDASVVTFSLDKNKSVQLIDDIVNKSGIGPYKPGFRPKSFTGIMDDITIKIERSKYDVISRIAFASKSSLESVFGAVRYSDFLICYRGLTGQEGREMASKRYGVPEELLMGNA